MVIEVLQSIKASDMTPMLQHIYGSEGGSECLDVLMKYLYVKTRWAAGRESGQPPAREACCRREADDSLLQVQGHGVLAGQLGKRTADADARHAAADGL